MPKVLTDAQVRAFERDGCLWPVRAMSAERARHYRERFEALEARVPDIKKMKTKSHLLCPWVLEIAEDPHILDVFEDLIGPNIRCWSMAWRVKKADGETFAGWHQDSSYGAALPVVLGGLALSECSVKQGCLAHEGDPRAGGEGRSEEHPRARAVHHRSVRRLEGRGLRALARRDGDVRQLARPQLGRQFRPRPSLPAARRDAA